MNLILNIPTSSDPVLGFYQNYCSLRSELVNFKCKVSRFNFIIVILSETWLTNNFFDYKLDLTNYNIFRSDRWLG